MAKKKKIEVEEPQVQEQIVETPEDIREKPLPTPENTWEVKDRLYYLRGREKPISYMIRSSDIYYFDEDLGYERELKYTKNQKTPFVDEMKGDQRLDHIIFRNGSLFVPRNKQTLQKLLSLYHPHRDQVFEEYRPIKEAEDQMTVLEMEADALLAAKNMDIDMAEAILRVENGSSVSNMSSKELKRDLLIFAKKNPKLFLDLATDENVQLRNFGIKATELGILNLSSDQRYFSWASNGRKLLTVPFDEHPYSALAAWFKTDEGMEIYSNIEKRLND
tara:strand:- start:2039 stop:2866 length:828 start_codon:yes stop_codon:yes gene_type:complete